MTTQVPVINGYSNEHANGDTFLFSSESVGDGHPGITIVLFDSLNNLISSI